MNREEKVQLVADTIIEGMFAPHEIPVPDDLVELYRVVAHKVLDKLGAPAQEAREPAGWLHQIKEPTDPNIHRMYSASPDNPWGHWQQSYKDQCQYTATALYAGPDSTLPSTTCATPIMRAAENAAKVVDGWSDAKKDYAERVTASSVSSTLRGDAP